MILGTQELKYWGILRMGRNTGMMAKNTDKMGEMVTKKCDVH